MKPKPPPRFAIIPVLKPFLATAKHARTDYLGQQLNDGARYAGFRARNI
jgi:hypothetical protein